MEGKLDPVATMALFKQKLQSLNPEVCELRDITGACGCGLKLFCLIVASEFDGVALIDRQRKVQEILAEEIAKIHAFELKTWTPEQWGKKKDTFELPG